jgi:hypothetical protein
VLFAFGRYPADEELPLWVRRWMLDFIAKVLRAAFRENPEQAIREMVRALGLTRQGWNAVTQLRQYLADDVLAWLRSQGISAADLAAMLPSPEGDRIGIDPTGVYRRTNRTYKRWPRIGPRRRPRAKK